MAARMRLLGGTSDLYVGKSTLLKSFLLGGVAIISAFFIWYTLQLIETLQEDTREQVKKYVQLWQEAANSPTSGSELQFIFNEIIVKASFPLIVLDDTEEPLYWRNIEGVEEMDTTLVAKTKIRAVAAEMLSANGKFQLNIDETHHNYLLYGDTEVIKQLKLMPFIQIGIVLAFMLVGMIGFQNIRRSEERHIWVGMAKEAAHQLGTPISSLLGWIEVLGSERPTSPECSQQNELVDETVSNMKVDVDRLQRVANRFGLIGSVPDLKPSSLTELLDEVVEYYRRRLPFHGEGIRMEIIHGQIPDIPLNAELLTWAFENLLKNAIQAVDPKTGRIELLTTLQAEDKLVLIEVKDNGKGITAAAARKIFRPGFTTKKRGWGLGLTLVKRIIEDYHGGQVHLHRSKPGETVFHLTLPTIAKR